MRLARSVAMDIREDPDTLALRRDLLPRNEHERRVRRRAEDHEISVTTVANNQAGHTYCSETQPTSSGKEAKRQLNYLEDGGTMS